MVDPVQHVRESLIEVGKVQQESQELDGAHVVKNEFGASATHQSSVVQEMLMYNTMVFPEDDLSIVIP